MNEKKIAACNLYELNSRSPYNASLWRASYTLNATALKSVLRHLRQIASVHSIWESRKSSGNSRHALIFKRSLRFYSNNVIIAIAKLYYCCGKF